MALFSSDRERRLWLWTLAVVVAIYSTLGVAPILAGVLREHGLLETFFVLGMVLVGATIFTQGVKVRLGGAEVAVALGVTAVYLLLFVRMEATPEERTHLIEYGVVGVFIYEALAERASHGRRIQWRQVADNLRPKVEKLAALMDAAEADVLAFMTFPKELRAKLHSTNPLERLNKEIKRRTDVVGIFPNEAAIERLVGAVLLENNEEWMTTRRYMPLEAMAKIMQPHTIEPATLTVATA